MNKLTTLNASDAGFKSLYHYQRYKEDQVLDTFKNRRIRCSNLANLNDPWDCKPVLKVDDDESAAKTIAAFQKAPRPDSREPYYDSMMDEMLLKDPSVFRVLVAKTVEVINTQNVEQQRLYCLTPHVDSTLMWSHYAENHRGICLEFAVRPGNVFATALKVFYSQDFLPFEFYNSETTALSSLFLVKARCWSYEDEYRLLLRIKEPAAEKLFPECMLVTDNFFPLTGDSLKSVVLGCETLHATGICVRQLVDEHWPEIAVKKMHRKPDKYELELRDFIV